MTLPARMRLRLLGRLALTGEDGLPVRLVTRKCGALLAYLATCPEQAASREQLATLLWGGCADAQARQSLRQALVLLRKELNAGELFQADKTHVRLTPGAWTIDLAAFEALARSAEPQLLAQAAALFGGAFLVLADALARTIVAPAELPIGVLTALVGGPFFLWLLAGRAAREGL